MSHFLRRLSISGRNSFIRAIAIASGGSGFLYFNGNTDLRASVTVRIPASLRESLSLPCQLEHELFLGPSPFAIDHGLSGMFPLYSLSVSPVSTSDKKNEAFGIVDPVSTSDKKNEAFGIVDDGSKPCGCGCLGKDSIANAAEKVAPSVVNISAAQGFYGIRAGKSIGTGTIIDKDGTILTCAHVVVDLEGMISTSKGKVDVTLQDGRTFEGIVLNVDLHSDIAIVKINSQTPLPAAQLGSSSRLRPGDWVIAMGCPLSLQNTVTAGIVSCVDRKSSDLGLVGMRREYLQTDCAINVGNSGGPLVNIDGEVVGVNIMKVVAADGVGFSVPIDSVRKIIEQFKKNGRVVRPWLGVKMMDLNEMTLSQIKKRDASFPNIKKGVVVPMVTPGSPADRAGFRPRDIVVEFDGKPVENSDEIVEIMGDRIGVPMKVVVIRAPDEIKTLTVIPEEANLDL